MHRASAIFYRVSQTILLTLCSAMAVLAAGCSGFGGAWKKALRQPVPQEAITGPWQGTWVSEESGHTDKLRCLISHQTNSLYRARFHAKYRKIFSFGYTVSLQVHQTNGVYIFAGDADLGWYAGGQYHYEGEATPTNFIARYRAKSDHGVFRLTRPETAPSERSEP